MASLKPLLTAVFLLTTSLSARTLNRYALILNDPPAASAKSVVRLGLGPEVLRAADAVRQKQNTLRAELQRRKFHVTGATGLLVNAIYVDADPARLAELSGLPGVRGVAFLPAVHRSLDHAEQLVNLQAAWTLLGGISNSGAGVKIAVIDSGIDNTHPAFQDPSLTPPPGYPLCQPADCAYTSNKVIVARSYIRQAAAGSTDDPAADSRPDDFSPRDHQGHGTAVGAIIAGVTNSGPGDTITGFAPKAFLGNYKVFGTTGLNDNATEDTVIAALEDAVKDGMDIANMSLGGPALTGALDTGAACGMAPGVPCDTLSQAVENATSLGMLVVTAAGNEGGTGSSFPALATTESPGIAPGAISVAASTNSHIWNFAAGNWVSIDISIFNQVANFSSRGPAIGTAGIKPDLAAVGNNLFLPAQNFDPTGDLYSALRYTVSNGTSFSSPMVAGAAALVKQLHPTWQPWELKSALVNSTTQDVIDGIQPAHVTAVGSGKLNVGNAALAGVTVNPATASFGAPQSLPVNLSFQVRNGAPFAVTLTLTVDPRTTDANASITLSPATLTLACGETAQFTASLQGTMPAPGSYEGFITLHTSALSSDAPALRIPYLYSVSDGVPANMIPLLGFGAIGPAGQEVPDGMLAFEVIDQYGLPVANVPATFGVLLGGGSIDKSDAVTNGYGIATASAIMGPSTATNAYSGSAAGMRVQFVNTGVAQPTISDSGVVNAASFQRGPGIAPGSYVSIFGANLSLGVSRATTVNLPASLQNSSVSFDVPEAGISVPGHLTYVNPQQVNVQVPWELHGQTSVRLKVSISNASGAVFTAPVADYSPGLFADSSGMAVAQDSTFAPVTAANPALRGQTITLYGTGFGPVNHTPPSGESAPDSTSTTLTVPVVTLGGVPATVVFSGLAPGFAGLYQLNVAIPSDVAPGVQPLAVSANGIAANLVQLPVQ